MGTSQEEEDPAAAADPVKQQASPSQGQMRRVTLDDLLTSLSAWDLLYIRSKFREGKIAFEGFAGLGELPPEVIAYIVPHLGLKDVLNCFLVCRSWSKIWTQGAITTTLCRRFFPGLLELYGGDVPDRFELFVAATNTYLKRHLVRCVQRSFISWDVGWSSDHFRNQQQPDVELLEDLRQVDFGFSHTTICYENGKLAWQPGNCYVIIDDLRTRQRHRLSFGIDYISGRPMQLQAVTESLVVLASSLSPVWSSQPTNQGQAIQVFNLDLMESKRISLPGKFARCYAKGDTAVFVTKQGHVIAWSWGDKAVELNTDPTHRLLEGPMACKKDLDGVPGVLFHPTETSVFYVVWLVSEEPPNAVINHVVVIKYENSQPVKRFTTDMELRGYGRDPQSRHSCPAMRFTLTCRKMNWHGSYSIGLAQFVLRDEGFQARANDREDAEWMLIGFNVLTERFTQYEYQSRRRPYPPHVKYFDVCAWDDQLIITWFDEYLIGRQYPYGMEWLDASKVVSWEGWGRRTDGADSQTKRLRVDICTYMLQVGCGRRIFADEDFLIVTTGQGYLVCSWNKDVDLPGRTPTGSLGIMATAATGVPPWPTGGERLEPPRFTTPWDSRTVASLRSVEKEAPPPRSSLWLNDAVL